MGLFSGLFGGSKKQVVGYRYFIGTHFVCCNGPVDKILEIRVDDKIAWKEVLDAAPVPVIPAPTNLYLGTTVQTFGNEQQTFQCDINARWDYDPAIAYYKFTWSAPETGTKDDKLSAISGEKIVYSSENNGSQVLTSVLNVNTNNAGRTYTIKVKGFNTTDNTQTEWVSGTILTNYISSQPLTLVSGGGSGNGSPTNADETTIFIDKPELFGGEDREGGVVGYVSLLLGGPAQKKDAYLESKSAGGSAFRGVVSTVLRQVEIGMNPYLKPWAFKVQRVFTAQDGAEQWYAAKAPIGLNISFEDTAVYFALDVSNSMFGQRLSTMKAAMIIVLNQLEAALGELPSDIHISAFSGTATTITRRTVDAAAFDDLRAFVNGLATVNTTNFQAGVAAATAYFADAGTKRRILVFVTDGEPNPGTLAPTVAIVNSLGVFSYGFNIELANTSSTAQLDNTPADGVPVVSGSNPEAMATSLLAAFQNGYEMNAVHIIRECLSNSEWGLGYQDADIGDTFTAAADAAYAEGFGLSIKWDEESEVEEFINLIQNHLDCYVYVDRVTGKWEIKLVRDDYNVGSLFTLDDTKIIKYSSLERKDPADAVNSITIDYTDFRTFETASRSLQDLALVGESGRVKHESVEYVGITYEPLAIRVAERDLRALSAPIATGTLTVNRKAEGLNPGDPFLLNAPRYGLNNEVCRVVDIQFSAKNDQEIQLKFASDVFALDDNVLIKGDFNPPNFQNAPAPATVRLVEEAPYYELVRNSSKSAVDSALAAESDLGYLNLAAASPTPDAINAEIRVDGIASGNLDFAPGAVTTSDLGPFATDITVSIQNATDILDVANGTLVSIGNEIMRVDSVSSFSLTLGRGVLDTIPQPHPAGSSVIFWGEFSVSTDVEYVASESVGVRLLPITSLGKLALGLAPLDTVVFDSRAIRPFPVGNLKANGQYRLNVATSSDIVLTWNHRDRKTQTTNTYIDYDDGDVGPETGVEYTVEVAWVDEDENLISVSSSVNVAQAKTYTVLSGSIGAPPSNAAFTAFRVRSNRNSYTEWQTPQVLMPSIGYGNGYGLNYGL